MLCKTETVKNDGGTVYTNFTKTLVDISQYQFISSSLTSNEAKPLEI
jgi:hypothetical protein